MEAIFKSLIGHSFVFSQADEHWKAKRRASAHAFYKDRLVKQIDVFKIIMRDACENWVQKAEKSTNKSVVVDI